MNPSIPVPPSTRAMPLHDEIAARAYELWEKRGRPEGRDVETWLEAEAQLLGTDPAVNQSSAGAVPAAPLAEAVSGGKKQRTPKGAPKLTTNTSR